MRKMFTLQLRFLSLKWQVQSHVFKRTAMSVRADSEISHILSLCTHNTMDSTLEETRLAPWLAEANHFGPLTVFSQNRR
jgi:hypothetical protein